MAWDERMKDFHARPATARGMGAPERLARRRAAGALDARERVARPLDPDSFLEIGTFNASDVPGAGMTGGIAREMSPRRRPLGRAGRSTSHSALTASRLDAIRRRRTRLHSHRRSQHDRIGPVVTAARRMVHPVAPLLEVAQLPGHPTPSE